MAYVESLSTAMGHADRALPLRNYCTGLLMPLERKSVEPMAALVAPGSVSAQHQSLLHLVGQAPWSDEAVLCKVRELVVPEMERAGPIEAWIVDDTGFVKKGVHSVGVARQYCGRLGKTDNCQVAVSLSIANHASSLPIAYRLYLPEEWANDMARRGKAHVPPEVTFETKPQIALDQMAAALADGVAPAVVLADAGYGTNGAFRAGVTALGLRYAVGVQSTLRVRRLGKAPVSVKTLATALPERAWRVVCWREGSNDPLSSRFAALRVRPASRDGQRSSPPEWLVIEWPEGEKEPMKYWLSTLPADIALGDLVDTIKLRWRIERDYEELKSELGLAHFEGRGWRGFHHHATLCIAAYGFLIRERAAFPPCAIRRRQMPRLSDRPRPRGAACSPRTSCRGFDRNHPQAAQRRSGSDADPLPLLPIRAMETTPSRHFVTQ